MDPARGCARTRQIGWNGVRFELPVSWEVVVAGPCHLLVDHDLTPLFEIRWQPAGPRPARDLPTLLRQATDGAGGLQPSPPPPAFVHLPFDELTGLAAPETTGQSGLCWRCRECGTVFLVLFHAGPHLIEHPLPELLGSLTCHRPAAESSLWKVQDFRLELPPGYTFIDSAFKAGLSRLAFAGSGLRLTFCRLAPASARLARSTMAELLQTMMGRAGQLALTSSDGMSLEYQRSVTIWQQLASRLLGKQLFGRGRIWLDRDSDRLLVLVVDSRRPIDPGLVSSLCERYESVR